MSIPIPITVDSAFFETQVTLEDVTYTFEFRWNTRAAAWFLNILDAQGTNMIRAGLKLITDFPIWLYSATRTPPGLLMVVDTTGDGDADPDLEGLGQRWQLRYYTTTELGL